VELGLLHIVKLTGGKIDIMETITVSSKGQIAIPKAIRDTLNLRNGTKLTLEVQGQRIVLSKEPAWKRLRGAAAGSGLVKGFAAYKKQERQREDSRS
jgi:AbrB family looped-hinge helix DNA binding protein